MPEMKWTRQQLSQDEAHRLQMEREEREANKAAAKVKAVAKAAVKAATGGR